MTKDKFDWLFNGPMYSGPCEPGKERFEYYSDMFPFGTRVRAYGTPMDGENGVVKPIPEHVEYRPGRVPVTFDRFNNSYFWMAACNLKIVSTEPK